MDFKKEISHLNVQIALFEQSLHEIQPSKIGYNELTSVIGPLISMSIDTVKSIILLANNNCLRDLIILSRPFVESIINIGFICAKGDEAINKSKQYAYQKGYRDLFRDLKINDFEIKSGFSKYKNVFDAEVPNNLRAALDAFTTNKDKEKNSWTEETTKQKLEIVGDKYGIGVTGFLTFAFYTIYRDVSEIIHGSYYGMRIFTGMQTKDITDFKSSNEAAEYFTKHQLQLATLVLQQVSIAIYSIIEILDNEFSNTSGIKAIKLKSKEELSNYTHETNRSL